MSKIITGKISIMGDFIKGLQGCKTILDLGCAKGGKLDKVCQALDAKGLGVELDLDIVKIARQNKRVRVVYGDVLEYITTVDSNSYDGVMMIDVLEHFEKEDVYRVIAEVERIAKKAIIAAIPIEHVKMRAHSEELMEHKSMWTVQEVFDLWKGQANIIYDAHFHERLTAKRGVEQVEELRRKHYHNSEYPGWTLSIRRM